MRWRRKATRGETASERLREATPALRYDVAAGLERHRERRRPRAARLGRIPRADATDGATTAYAGSAEQVGARSRQR
jgi:hypothetical protein